MSYPPVRADSRRTSLNSSTTATGVREQPAISPQQGVRLGDGERLAGQRRLFQLPPDTFHDPAVGRNAIAGVQDHDIARHQLLRGDLAFLCISNDVRHGHGLLAQRIQRCLCLPFGEKANDRVQDDDDQDGHRFDAFSQRQGHDEAAELAQQDRKARARLDRR
jgi:hypothetical protein